MVRVFFLLVLLCMPFPALAIPSPDFLGPVLAWVAAMTGIVTAGIGVAFSAARRAFASWKISRATWILGGVSVAACAFVLVLIAGAFRYQSFMEAYHRSVASIWPTNPPVVTTSSTIPLPNPSATIGPISSRVSSTKLLVPTQILRDVTADPSWTDQVTVLDIREPEERLIGYIPVTTTRIRYGDLVHGATSTLPLDRDILVICWTSMRGSEIATWLRTHGYSRAFAIEGGLQGDESHEITGWIDAGLPWQGDDRWSARFVNFEYLTRAEAEQLQDSGAIILDLREETSFAKGHLRGAVSLPIREQSTQEIETTIATLTPKKPLLVYCSGWVDCFYGRVIGERLKARGWDYRVPYRDRPDGTWMQTRPMESS